MYDDEPILRSEKSFGVKAKPSNKTKPAKQLRDWYFPEVTFENSPQQVKIKLVKEE